MTAIAACGEQRVKSRRIVCGFGAGGRGPVLHQFGHHRAVLVNWTPARSIRRHDVSSSIGFEDPQASQTTLTLKPSSAALIARDAMQIPVVTPAIAKLRFPILRQARAKSRYRERARVPRQRIRPGNSVRCRIRGLLTLEHRALHLAGDGYGATSTGKPAPGHSRRQTGGLDLGARSALINLK